ncbi:TetR family transcriptional regulator [Desulfobacula sp.]|uniref:TetR/AcrR family transcriptional regulator n=1 Tax=Desulfobacula sp. TaxID=2593537 RepID=UPI002617B212|nr:TetR family transcriptional regulator [Desulfobacula sp.]
MNARKNGLGTDPRKQILKAAQKAFSQKGSTDSSISKIASRAGVTDSIIYHYFKNKEDLLFYALADKFTDFEKDLRLHMEGIIDPVSKLGKMIWHHLYAIDLDPSDSQILTNLLIECRSNKNFYTHEGYATLKKYNNRMGQIIQQGIDEHLFSPDTNVSLTLNLIFGLLDEVSLSCFASREIEATLPDWPGIMNLVFAIIPGDAVQLHNTTGNKDKRILKAAVRVFAKKGYNASTMNEIANEANVGEGTLYLYFKNKEDILFSIPKKQLRRLKNSGGALFNIQHPIKKLRRFIRLLFTIFMEDRDFAKVFLLDIKLNKKFYKSPLYKDYIDYMSILESILEEGQEQGLFKESIVPRLFRSLVLGAFTYLAIQWTIVEKEKPIDMLQGIEEAVAMLCRCVVVDGSIVTELDSIYK